MCAHVREGGVYARMICAATCRVSTDGVCVCVRVRVFVGVCVCVRV